MEDPLVAGKPELKKKIKQVMKNEGTKEDQGPARGATIDPQKEDRKGVTVKEEHGSEKNTCLVTLGTITYQDGKRQKPTQGIQVIQLHVNNTVFSMATVGSGAIRDGVKICTQDNVLYASGVGDNIDEVWKWVMSHNKIMKSER